MSYDEDVRQPAMNKEAFARQIKELRNNIASENETASAKKRFSALSDETVSDVKSIDDTLYRSIANYISSFESGHALPAEQLGRSAELWYDIASSVIEENQPEGWDNLLNTLTKISLAPSHYQSGSAAEELRTCLDTPSVAKLLLDLEVK